MTSRIATQEVGPQLEEKSSWLERPLIAQLPSISAETVLIAVIMLLAVFSRFYILGDRVMSHDEVNHVVPSFDLFQGRGYRHDPVTHGPFQFHIVALSFFLLGDSDFTARIPAALFSIATVFFAWWGFRHYLGRAGALGASLMMLISPYILFYGRYTRNEAFVGLSGVVMLYVILRYLETGSNRFLYVLTITTVFHFIVKETSYIYVAQALLFLGFLFLYRLSRRPWRDPAYQRYFFIGLVTGLVLLGAGMATLALSKAPEATPATPTVAPLPGPTETATTTANAIPPLAIGLFAVAGIELLVTVYFLIKGFTLTAMRRERSFDLLVLLGTLVLPLLAPFPVKLVGWNPIDYTDAGILHTAIALVPMILIAAAIGLWWRPKLWLYNAACFYAIFIVFYTTFFTNGSGFLTGLVGSLGYWLEQQGVQRGSQPLYYYALVQIPIYEFLPAIGMILAILLGWRHPERAVVPEALVPAPESLAPVAPDGETELSIEDSPVSEIGEAYEVAEENEVDVEMGETEREPQPKFSVPVLGLLIFWSLTSLLAYSIAGEKMPWLTVHITLGMILAAGWALGYLFETTPWRSIFEKRGLLALLLLPVFFTSLAAVIGSWLGNQPPFQGSTLEQLQATSTFLFAAVMLLASAAGLVKLTLGWTGFEVGRAMLAVLFALLAVQTARAAIRASYIDYDTAQEFLVYAHAARGPKDVLAEVEDLSHHTVGGLDIAVAYDNETLYPYWWYFRKYPNKVYYADKPTRDLRNNPVIIVGDANYSKIESIVGDNYTMYETTRLWWPNQDYFNLTWERILDAIKDPAIRAGIWQIWFNRDYTQYAQATNNTNLTLTTWVPANRMRVYIRKDIVSQIWKYGVAPTAPVTAVDPYAAGTIKLEADQVLGAPGDQPGQFHTPRGLAVAPDGSLYVADSRNHRIQHFAADGALLGSWGSFGESPQGGPAAPAGRFNEPWDVAVGADGAVYVADTWNNRIQKFTAQGDFVQMWGYFGQAETPEAFWGPRALALTPRGNLLVSDTGNKRVVVFTPQGDFVTQFGAAGSGAGELDEPVGLGVDAAGAVYVADTWNQRVQVFTPSADGRSYAYAREWAISGWYGESLDNKPYLAVDGARGRIFVSDPEAYRILEFDLDGKFLRAWGDNSSGPDGFGLASGVALDAQGNLWAADAGEGNMRVLHFVVPQ